MCYSEQKSLETLIVNHISGIILYYTYDPLMALYFMYAGVMQFWDYVFWKNQEKNEINYWSTKMAMISNNTQPIVLGILIYLYNGNLFLYEKIALLFYSLITIIYSIYSWFKIDYTLVTKKSSPGLFWEWNYLPGHLLYYTFYLITVCILVFHYPFPINYLYVFATLITFILSKYKYHESLSTGRLWCFFAAYSPIYIMIMYIILGKILGKKMS